MIGVVILCIADLDRCGHFVHCWSWSVLSFCALLIMIGVVILCVADHDRCCHFVHCWSWSALYSLLHFFLITTSVVILIIVDHDQSCNLQMWSPDDTWTLSLLSCFFFSSIQNHKPCQPVSGNLSVVSPLWSWWWNLLCYRGLNMDFASLINSSCGGFFCLFVLSVCAFICYVPPPFPFFFLDPNDIKLTILMLA